MIRRPPRSTQGVSSAASDVYKRQVLCHWLCGHGSDWISHQTSFHPCKQYFAWLKRIILFFHYNARKKKKKKKKKTYHEKSKKQKKHNILNDLRELHTKRKHRYDQQT
eukprot:TRINITY_DN11374_c0_g1_i2.p1 TRINITY_DN11374_c0_g1~~TRINITY_DN11374_c0_g1_i2.p1  ORF type:complete len:108 (-),score=27.65 TRINITY_DN11374_c0_g1_i2:18-341(-)